MLLTKYQDTRTFCFRQKKNFSRKSICIIYYFNSTKGDNQLIKIRVSYFLMPSPSIYEIFKPYLKFVTDGRTDSQTKGRTSPKQYAPLTFSKLGALK